MLWKESLSEPFKLPLPTPLFTLMKWMATAEQSFLAGTHNVTKDTPPIVTKADAI